MYVILALAVLITLGNSLPNGAPDVACEELTPAHLVDPQTSPFPYKVEVVKDGSKYKVTLSAEGNDNFRGFLMQARRGDGSSSKVPVGKFEGFDEESKALECDNKAASSATHTNALTKKSVTVTWDPNGENINDVSIYTSAVRIFAQFWVKHKSPLP